VLRRYGYDFPKANSEIDGRLKQLPLYDAKLRRRSAEGEEPGSNLLRFAHTGA
jgi:hypothetical protein